MGSLLGRNRRQDPTTEFYPDKVVKYAGIAPILVLAIIALIVLYGVDKVKCSVGSQYSTEYREDVEDYCWTRLRPASKVTRINLTIWNETAFPTPPDNVTYKVWVEGAQMYKHKLYPILLICQCACFAIPLVIWYWCISAELKNHVAAVMEHANNLTAVYRKYDRSQLRTDEADVHRELDNYLEYLGYLLMTKSKKLYILHLIKWMVILIVVVAWFAANLSIFSPNFEIFREQFTCLYDKNEQITFPCYFPSTMFLRVLWYINIAMLGLLIIIMLFYIIVDLCLPRKYHDTFFHRSIPGAMDYRLAHCIQRNYDPRLYWFLSRLCSENEHLSTNPGLSKTLARKYGTYQGGKHGYGDHSAVFALGVGGKRAFIQQPQVDRFVESSTKNAGSPASSSGLSSCCNSCFGRGGGGGGGGDGDDDLDDSQGAQDSDGDRQRGQGRVSRKPRRPLHGNVGYDVDLIDYYMNQKGEKPDKRVKHRPGGTTSDLPNEYTPPHTYSRELLQGNPKYRYVNGLPVIHPRGHSPTSRRSGNKSSSPRRKVLFRLPRWTKGFDQRRKRRPSVASTQPSVASSPTQEIIVEDLDVYPSNEEAQPAPRLYGRDYGKNYGNPYGGPLSSKVLKPYYDPATGQIINLNPLAYKVRRSIKQDTAKLLKVWKPP